MIKAIQPVFKSLLIFSISVFVLCACALRPPVQEMSDARQALQAAETANAAEYASETYQNAQQLLEQARVNLEMGEFFEAREMAIEAKHLAMRARYKSRLAQKLNP